MEAVTKVDKLLIGEMSYDFLLWLVDCLYGEIWCPYNICGCFVIRHC